LKIIRQNKSCVALKINHPLFRKINCVIVAINKKRGRGELRARSKERERIKVGERIFPFLGGKGAKQKEGEKIFPPLGG